MADDLEVKPVDQPVEPPALTEAEQRASEQGWVPKDQWDESKGRWRSAEDFLDRGELFKKIDEQNKEIKRVKQTLIDQHKHQSKIAEAEYKRALETLKAQKKEALLEGDADAVIDIDDRIDEVKEAQRVASQPQPEVQPVSNPVFESWVERNGWYNQNRAMRAYADAIGVEAASRGMSVTDALAFVDREVRKEFPDKFTNPNRAKAAAVEGSNAKNTAKETKLELSDDERRVMNRFISTIPGYTKEMYMAELKKIKGV